MVVMAAMPCGAEPRSGGRAQRLIVLTDIEADPDDTQSLVRLLLYSNEIDLEGLIATQSAHKWNAIAPEAIRKVIRAYGRVQANLVKHDARYPAAERLLGLVKAGQSEYGAAGVGAGKESEGSAWILRVLEKNDERPLWIAIWGGANTLEQALRTLRESKPKEEAERLIGKLRVYALADQDDSGPRIRRDFPQLFYIVSPGEDYRSATWTGVNAVVEGIDNTTISNRWLAENIQQGHGPLGAAYPDAAWNVEGDTPTFLGLIPNGLNEPERPDWGGWGGRYALYRPDEPATGPRTFGGGRPIPPETRAIWTDAEDEYAPPVASEHGRAMRPGQNRFKEAMASVWRWRDDFQNDFAARMDWTVKPYAEANHPPVPALDHPEALTVPPGKRIELSARGTTDPDGDSLSYYWFPYPEAGSFRGEVKIDGAENANFAWVTTPKVEKPETIHFILRVTDKGRPALSRYKRVVVTVTP
jgi:hypothetical protein